MDAPIEPQAINDPIENETASRSWWLWMAWIERTNGGGFVYGCAARNSGSPGWRDEATIEIPAGKLIVHQVSVADQNFSRFRDALGSGQIDASSLLRSRKDQVRIAATRAILQTGLGQSGVRTVLHYTLPNVQDLVGLQDGALESILSVLQEQIGLPFTGATPRISVILSCSSCTPGSMRRPPSLSRLFRTRTSIAAVPKSWKFVGWLSSRRRPTSRTSSAG